MRSQISWVASREACVSCATLCPSGKGKLAVRKLPRRVVRQILAQVIKDAGEEEPAFDFCCPPSSFSSLERSARAPPGAMTDGSSGNHLRDVLVACHAEEIVGTRLATQCDTHGRVRAMPIWLIS